MRQRGLRVVVVTNSLSSTDVAPVHAGYSRSRKALLEAGVELWEIRDDPARRDRERRGLGHSASSLHAKAFAVDRRYLFVGSFNFDPRSVNINTEMGIVVDSPESSRPGGGAVVPSPAHASLPVAAGRGRGYRVGGAGEQYGGGVSDGTTHKLLEALPGGLSAVAAH